MTELAEIKRLLLAMTGPARRQPEAAEWVALSDADWQVLDSMAAQHRLHPWLHHRRRSDGLHWPIPYAIAARWQAAYRDGAFGALTAQAGLVRLAGAFAEAKVAMVALKGARLAFLDYPEATLRPMRDLDILVAPDDLPRALDAMAAAGCTIPADRDAAISRALDGDKHLDPIFLPACERNVELHHRIADPSLPCIATEAILADARMARIADVDVAFPSPEHMLGHLVLHAVYNHRFDCGPLALVDIAMMARRETVDARSFAALAESGGWLAGAQLLLALVESHFGPIGIPIGQDEVPDAIRRESELLILQDFEQRAQVKLASETARDGLGATLAKRLKRGLSSPRGECRLTWLASRATRTIRQGSDPRARSEASAGAAVSRWLKAAPSASNTPD